MTKKAKQNTVFHLNLIQSRALLQGLNGLGHADLSYQSLHTIFSKNRINACNSRVDFWILVWHWTNIKILVQVDHPHALTIALWKEKFSRGQCADGATCCSLGARRIHFPYLAQCCSSPHGANHICATSGSEQSRLLLRLGLVSKTSTRSWLLRSLVCSSPTNLPTANPRTLHSLMQKAPPSRSSLQGRKGHQNFVTVLYCTLYCTVQHFVLCTVLCIVQYKLYS